MRRTFLLASVTVFALQAQPYTRGVGVYPGDPKEDFAPMLAPDPQTYRISLTGAQGGYGFPRDD
jgi:hypothetical protein